MAQAPQMLALLILKAIGIDDCNMSINGVFSTAFLT